jgi:hypothetical protein
MIEELLKKNTSTTNVKNNSKTSSIKETNTLDNKHRQMVKHFNNLRLEKDDILIKISEIDTQIKQIDDSRFNLSLDNKNNLSNRAKLLDLKDELNQKYNLIVSNFDEMDYYDNTGDLITEYYTVRDNNEPVVKETKTIIEFLSQKQEKVNNNNNTDKNNRAKLFEKYCHRVEGIRINKDDGSNRIKYCDECKIEKILDMGQSSYICPCCGDSETIILDEDRQIKDYSPYRRLNHFREWLNQFQAKQSPDIPDQVFIDIIKELNKNRISDLSILNKKKMKIILKKLNYNMYYEHVAYIINKLNNLPPPKITRDMEKIFISMFFAIQEPWEMYKQANRKNFLSYSYVLHKFCELLELDHLLDCFPLHKDPHKIIENDQIWEKICNHLNWEFIISFK